jgi:hypothetical protein
MFECSGYHVEKVLLFEMNRVSGLVLVAMVAAASFR